jgi:hypothetical protein
MTEAQNGKRIAVVAGAAFVAGKLAAKWIDWRTNAHPHD